MLIRDRHGRCGDAPAALEVFQDFLGSASGHFQGVTDRGVLDRIPGVAADQRVDRLMPVGQECELTIVKGPRARQAEVMIREGLVSYVMAGPADEALAVCTEWIGMKRFAPIRNGLASLQVSLAQRATDEKWMKLSPADLDSIVSDS